MYMYICRLDVHVVIVYVHVHVLYCVMGKHWVGGNGLAKNLNW